MWTSITGEIVEKSYFVRSPSKSSVDIFPSKTSQQEQRKKKIVHQSKMQFIHYATLIQSQVNLQETFSAFSNGKASKLVLTQLTREFEI